MKSDKNGKSVTVPDITSAISQLNPTSHRGVNTIISVALLVLVSLGFIVGFQQIGTDFIGSVEQPVQANVEASQTDTGQVDLIVQSMSDNVDTMRVRAVDDDGSGVDSDSDIDNNANGDLNTSFTDGDSVVSVGDNVKINGLDDGDQVIVSARDNPDNSAVVLEYEYDT